MIMRLLRNVLCPVGVALLLAAESLLSRPLRTLPGHRTAKPAAAGSQLPKMKQTTLGLYVTAAQAYEMWKASPDKVKVIDVRTPEEFAFVGHPEMAWNIPRLRELPKKGRQVHVRAANEQGFRRPGQGDRPADRHPAGHVQVRRPRRNGRQRVAAAGFTKAYNIVDGIEGDTVDDPESVFHGKRMKNGWKNSAPYVYNVDPKKIIIEEGASLQIR